MQPIRTPETNALYGTNQEEYLPLPAVATGDRNGTVVTCWKPSFRERLRLFFGGRIWLAHMTFGNALQPIYVTTEKGEVLQAAESDTPIEYI